DHESQVHQDRDEREDGRFLPAVLGGGGREDTGDLADETALQPQAAGLVEEALHLARHVAEARGRPEDDGVVVGEVLDLRDRRLLVELETGLAREVFGYGFRNAQDGGLRSGVAHARGDFLRHALDVAVGRVIEYEDVCHGGILSPRIIARYSARAES